MLRPELYHKTVDILFRAYFNDTLQHGNCYACAVGNLVAANLGFSFAEASPAEKGIGISICWSKQISPFWRNVFCTYFKEQELNVGEYRDEAKEEIDATGYAFMELAKIEYAFETASAGESKDEYMFNGLVAVLEALKQIHQIEDIEPEVSRFKQHYASRAV